MLPKIASEGIHPPAQHCFIIIVIYFILLGFSWFQNLWTLGSKWNPWWIAIQSVHLNLKLIGEINPQICFSFVEDRVALSMSPWITQSEKYPFSLFPFRCYLHEDFRRTNAVDDHWTQVFLKICEISNKWNANNLLLINSFSLGKKNLCTWISMAICFSHFKDNFLKSCDVFL